MEAPTKSSKHRLPALLAQVVLSALPLQYIRSSALLAPTTAALAKSSLPIAQHVHQAPSVQSSVSHLLLITLSLISNQDSSHQKTANMRRSCHVHQVLTTQQVALSLMHTLALPVQPDPLVERVPVTVL
jgi:hypothetical protein